MVYLQHGGSNSWRPNILLFISSNDSTETLETRKIEQKTQQREQLLHKLRKRTSVHSFQFLQWNCIMDVTPCIDVINIQIKIKNLKKREKHVCKGWITTLPKFATNQAMTVSHCFGILSQLHTIVTALSVAVCLSVSFRGLGSDEAWLWKRKKREKSFKNVEKRLLHLWPVHMFVD